MEDLVEGWTEPIRHTLLADGAAIDGTGLTVGLSLLDRCGGSVNTSSKVTWSTAASGIAKFTPVAGDLKAENSPYHARWSVTNGSEVAYYPNGEADVWVVRK